MTHPNPLLVLGLRARSAALWAAAGSGLGNTDRPLRQEALKASCTWAWPPAPAGTGRRQRTLLCSLASWEPGGILSLQPGDSNPRTGLCGLLQPGTYPPITGGGGEQCQLSSLGFLFQTARSCHHPEHTVGEKRTNTLVWNSHLCFYTGENALGTLRVKLKHQDNFSLSFWPLDMPEYCHQNCKLNFQLAVPLRGPSFHVYSED